MKYDEWQVNMRGLTHAGKPGGGAPAERVGGGIGNPAGKPGGNLSRLSIGRSPYKLDSPWLCHTRRKRRCPAG